MSTKDKMEVTFHSWKSEGEKKYKKNTKNREKAPPLKKKNQ